MTLILCCYTTLIMIFDFIFTAVFICTDLMIFSVHDVCIFVMAQCRIFAVVILNNILNVVILNKFLVCNITVVGSLPLEMV